MTAIETGATRARNRWHGRAAGWVARVSIDRYVLMLIATVALASFWPVRGAIKPRADLAVHAAVALLFLLYGARLSAGAIWAGLTHWRLQSLVAASTYLLFPLLGLGIVALFGRAMPASMASGFLFLAVLPSTVQSSIAFTSIARGNVPAALCAATVSNLLGVVLTPLLAALVLARSGMGFPLDAMKTIMMQILAPFVVGQVLRPHIGPWLAAHKPIVGAVDRGSILLVVYTAFSEGVIAGVWHQFSRTDMVVLVLIDAGLLAVVLALTTCLSRLFGFSREDEIAIVFCGSKKSMASGIPMASILFPGQAVSLMVLPLMLFHQAQLFACAILARRYRERED